MLSILSFPIFRSEWRTGINRNVKYMNRNKVIDELVEIYSEFLTNAGSAELEDLLACGFKGFDSYPDDELLEILKSLREISGIDEES